MSAYHRGSLALVTAFEPWADFDLNSSWEAVRLLAAGPLTLTEVAAETGRSPMGARRLLHALFSAGGLAVDGLSAVPTGATHPEPSPVPPDRSATATGIAG